MFIKIYREMPYRKLNSNNTAKLAPHTDGALLNFIKINDEKNIMNINTAKLASDDENIIINIENEYNIMNNNDEINNKENNRRLSVGPSFCCYN